MNPEVGKCYAFMQGNGALYKLEVLDIVTEDTTMNIDDRPIPGIYCQVTVIVPGSGTEKVGSSAESFTGLQTRFEYEWTKAMEVLYG